MSTNNITICQPFLMKVLSAYLDQIKNFPMLAAEEEHMLLKLENDW